MLRCSRLSRVALLSATALRRSPQMPSTVPSLAEAVNAPKKKPDASSATEQHSVTESSSPSSQLSKTTALPEMEDVLEHPPKFFFKGRRGNAAPEYYSTRSNAGHPDAVAELLGAGRDDPEWMWLKLLCFFCCMATFGTTLYGYFFAEHVKYFMDEPWSPFNY